MDFITKNWEGIVALFALLTSAISTIIAFYTFRLQRTHNIKSVRPILHIGQWDYENNIYVTLVNLGVGLAIVKNVCVTNKVDETKNCLYDWLPKKLAGDMNYKEYWTGFKSFVVQPGQVIKLIEIPVDTSKEYQIQEREKIRSILRQLTIKVTYKDIYENEMTMCEMELFHFSRTDNEN
jgi:hypothetical protein